MALLFANWRWGHAIFLITARNWPGGGLCANKVRWSFCGRVEFTSDTTQSVKVVGQKERKMMTYIWWRYRHAEEGFSPPADWRRILKCRC